MINIILKALGFVGVLVVCCALRKAGMFKKEDGVMLSRLMMNVTMPCALLTAGENVTFTPTLILTLVLGMLINLSLVILGTLNAAPYDRKMKGIFALNSAGFNVGSFALPFGQYFFPSGVLAYLCMFDVGNAIMNLGLDPMITSMIAGSDEKPSLAGSLKRLITTPAFTVYMIVIALAVIGWKIPEGIFTVISIAGNANAFVAMAMIGMLLEIDLPKNDRGRIARLLAVRYAAVFVIMFLIMRFFPAETDVKMMLCLCIATPITSVNPVFTREMIGESDIPAAANSLSIVISLVLMTIMMVIYSA